MNKPLSSGIGQWSVISLLVIILLIAGYVAVGNTHQHSLLSTISDSYATDGYYVYSNDHLIPGADAKSFKVLTDSAYAMDTHAVYYDGTPLVGANPSSFALISDTSYSKDDHTVFYQGSPIVADASTFKTLTTDCGCSGFATDKSAVYYEGAPIIGADPVSFSEISNDYFADANNVYYDNHKVAGADVASFVVSTDSTTTSTGIDYDAKDKNHLYYEGKRVK